MIPRLPPELISHIQVLAEEGESLVEQQKLRGRMERVNKEWHEAVDHMTNYIIMRSNKSYTLTIKLQKYNWRDLIRNKTRSVSIDMRRFQKGQEVKQLCKLLELFTHVERVVIDDWAGAAAIVEGYGNSSRLLGILGQFTNLRHFTLRRGMDHRTTPFT